MSRDVLINASLFQGPKGAKGEVGTLRNVLQTLRGPPGFPVSVQSRVQSRNRDGVVLASMYTWICINESHCAHTQECISQSGFRHSDVTHILDRRFYPMHHMADSLLGVVNSILGVPITKVQNSPNDIYILIC